MRNTIRSSKQKVQPTILSYRLIVLSFSQLFLEFYSCGDYGNLEYFLYTLNLANITSKIRIVAMFIMLKHLPEQRFYSENGGSTVLRNVGIKLMYRVILSLEVSNYCL